MIAYLIRRALAALDGLRKSPPPAGTRVTIGPATFTWIPAGSPEWDEMIRNAQQCRDLVEPPAETPANVKPEPEPVAQELVSEIVFDAAASRLWDCGQDDLDAWEDERIPAYVERGQR